MYHIYKLWTVMLHLALPAHCVCPGVWEGNKRLPNFKNEGSESSDKSPKQIILLEIWFRYSS